MDTQLYVQSIIGATDRRREGKEFWVMMEMKKGAEAPLVNYASRPARLRSFSFK
jgi:hypothetical protein